jgi:hypothetical protein
MHPHIFVLLIISVLALYLLPTAIAFSRKKKHRRIIAIVNILGGWIYGVPWLLALFGPSSDSKPTMPKVSRSGRLVLALCSPLSCSQLSTQPSVRRKKSSNLPKPLLRRPLRKPWPPLRLPLRTLLRPRSSFLPQRWFRAPQLRS